jgi:hypothetical protein
MEELKIYLQKKIIDRIVSELYKEDPNLYYAATIEISRYVTNKIGQDGYLSHEEFIIVENLKPTDVQNLLSYASSCC